MSNHADLITRLKMNNFSMLYCDDLKDAANALEAAAALSEPVEAPGEDERLEDALLRMERFHEQEECIHSLRASLRDAQGQLHKIREFRDELREDAIDEDGNSNPYMLYGDSCDLIKRFDAVLSILDSGVPITAAEPKNELSAVEKAQIESFSAKYGDCHRASPTQKCLSVPHEPWCSPTYSCDRFLRPGEPKPASQESERA